MLFRNGHNVNWKNGEFGEKYQKLQDNAVMYRPKKGGKIIWEDAPEFNGDQYYYGNPMNKIAEAMAIEILPEPEMPVFINDPRGKEWLENFAGNQVNNLDYTNLNASELVEKLRNDFTEKKLTEAGAQSMLDFAAPKNVNQNGLKVQAPVNQINNINNIANEEPQLLTV